MFLGDSMARSAPALVALTLSFCSSRFAFAQSAADSATAQALFDEAKSLMANGHAAEACPKLEESQRLDPGSGTLVNLARCYEQTGKIASAWTKYLEAAAAAKQSGNADRENVAREQANALRPRLSTLVITLSPEAKGIAGLEVTRDGERVGQAQLGVALPADPGEHTIVAKAPGFAAWQSKTVVEGDATSTAVSVPALSAEAAPAAPSAPAPARVDTGATDVSGGLGTQKIVALVAGGVGIVGLGVGTVFGLKSKSKHDEAANDCTGGSCTTQAGVDAGNDAHAAGNVATVGMIVGVVGVAAGVTLWLTAPSGKEAPSAQVGLGLGTVTMKGAF